MVACTGPGILTLHLDLLEGVYICQDTQTLLKILTLYQDPKSVSELTYFCEILRNERSSLNILQLWYLKREEIENSEFENSEFENSEFENSEF